MKKLTTIICLLIATTLHAQTVVVSGDGNVFEAEVGQQHFTKPSVVVRDGTADVTNQFFLNYYIKGHESDTVMYDNKMSTQNPVTGTYVSRLYGIVTIGSRAGYDTIRVVARPRTTGTYSQCESQYVIHIPKVRPYVVCSQDSIHVHPNQLFGHPTATLYRVSDGDTTDISSCFTVSYAHSAGISDFSMWWTNNQQVFQAPSAITTGETVTMTYTPTADYADSYEPFSRTYNVTMYEYTSSEPMPTHFEWTTPKYQTATNSTTVPVIKPILRDMYGNDVSLMVRWKYERLDPATQVINNLYSPDNDIYGTWFIQFGYRVNDSTTVRLYTYYTSEYGNPDNIAYQAGQSDTIIVQGRKLQWTFTTNPSSYDMYEGSMRLTDENWTMPEFVVYKYDGEQTTGGFQRRIGIPVEATFYNTGQGGANTKLTGDTITYRGQKYVMYEAENYTFPHGQWIDWAIDFNGWDKPDNVPYLIFEIYVYNDGQEEQTHYYYNYNINVHKNIDTRLSLSETRLSANVSKTEHTLIGFTEPTATVYNTNGTAVTDHFDLEYSIVADSSTLADAFSIDSLTGTLTYTGDGSTDGTLYVKVVATAKSAYADRYNNPQPAAYILNIRSTDFKYELITAYDQPDSTRYGKLHFIGTGTMAAGTVLSDIPGLSVQFGASGDDDWVFTTSENAELDDEGSNTGTTTVHMIYTEGTAVQLDDNEIPVSGTFAIFRPSVNGFLTIDGRWSNRNRFRLADVENGVIVETTDFLNSYQRDINGETRMWKVLLAGHTYYFYNYGNDDGTFEPTHLHGLTFEPAYIGTVDDHEPDYEATTFVNGYTGSMNWLLTSPADGVTFSVEKAPGTKDDVQLSDYLTINSTTGEITPLQTTANISESGYTGAGRNRVCIKAKVQNRAKTVTKEPWYYLFISDIPSYVVQNGETPSVGQTVTTTNIPTKITMTFGGWINGVGPYQPKDKVLYDSWKTAKTDTVGQRGMTIDGFIYASQGGENALDEDNNSFKESEDESSHTPFMLPCRGTYLKFDPEEDGTLIVYLLQNGVVDYNGSQQWSDLRNRYEMKVRPLYILDENARNVQLDNSWVIDANLLPSNSQQATRAGSYTEGEFRCMWNDEWVTNTLASHNITPKYTDSDYQDCPFDMNRYQNNKADLDSIMSKWKLYDGTSSTIRQEVIHLTQGHTLVSKAFVRYTFQVKAGKSYFVFQTGSKLSPCGFSFVPKYFHATAPEQTVITLNDNDDFDEKFRQYSEETSTSDDMKDINVVMNRKFGRDKWTGICLPFSVSESKFKSFFGSDASVITYDSVAVNGTGYFTQHVYHNIVANRPYFICPSKDIEAGDTIHNVTVEVDRRTPLSVADAKGEYAATGIFTQTTIPTGSYVFAGSSIYHLKTEQQLGAYRSYLAPLSQTASLITSFATSRGGYMPSPVPNGIIDIENDSGNSNHRVMTGVYNLQGQKVADTFSPYLPHGIYIVNGKKIAVR